MLDLTGAEESLAEADKERLAEDLRLLYVALTRGLCHLARAGAGALRGGQVGEDRPAPHRHRLPAAKAKKGTPPPWPPPSPSWPRLLPGWPSVSPLAHPPGPAARRRGATGEPKVREFKGPAWSGTGGSAPTPGLRPRARPRQGVLANPGFDDEVATEAAATVQDEGGASPFHLHLPQGRAPAPAPQPVPRPSTPDRVGASRWQSISPPLLAQEGFDEGWAPVLQQQVGGGAGYPLRPVLGIRCGCGIWAPERKQVELGVLPAHGAGDGPGADRALPAARPLSRAASRWALLPCRHAQGLYRPGVRSGRGAGICSTTNRTTLA